MSAIHQLVYFRVIKYTWIFNSVPRLCSDDGGRAIRAIKTIVSQNEILTELKTIPCRIW